MTVLVHLGGGAQVGAGVSLIFLGEMHLHFLPCGKPGVVVVVEEAILQGNNF